jgi:hypothetical protein
MSLGAFAGAGRTDDGEAFASSQSQIDAAQDRFAFKAERKGSALDLPAMRLAQQGGQKPRFLQEKATGQLFVPAFAR